MKQTKKIDSNIIFVDCFNTIILRKIKRNEVFKQWAQTLETEFKINWKLFYKLYKNVNFKLTLKRLSSFTLIEDFDVVLKNVYFKLSKKHPDLNADNFLLSAKSKYIQKELESFKVNEPFVSFLKTEKEKGKNIYLVSDFYCKSDVLTTWFENFKIADLFDKIFSSCDFMKEKATTKLYRFLLKHLKVKAKNVIMIGDNSWSDILMARVCGMHAKNIKRITYEKK